MVDLLINNRDAYAEWGVRMGDKFLDALDAPLPMKEPIENKSRLQHGKEVITDNVRVDERELTISFTIEGNSPKDFQYKKKAFYEELQKMKIDIQIPKNGNVVYHLFYLGKSISYAQSLDRTFAKISSKFCEPNPANRT